VKAFLVKAISWAVLSFFLALICHFLVDGGVESNVMWGCFWFCVLKTPFYWIHDLVWKGRKRAAVTIPLPVSI
jgi:hypothetical protein